MNKLVILGIALLLTACSTTYTPLKSNTNKLMIKVDNPDKNKSYNLFNSIDRNGVRGKVQNDEGIIIYDISGFTKSFENCYYIHDEKELIPIKEKVYKFTNPAVSTYLNINNRLNSEQLDFKTNTDQLNNNEAYRNRQCLVLNSSDMPEKPSSACSPQEEENFGLRRCESRDFKPTAEDRVINAAMCGTAGVSAGWITANPFIGAGVGYFCDWLTGETDKKNYFNHCMADSIKYCKDAYTKWRSKVSYLTNNSKEIYNECIQTQQNIEELGKRMHRTKEELAYVAESWQQVTENNYCK